MIALALVVACGLFQEPSWRDAAPHAARLIAVAADVDLEVLDFGGEGRPIVLLAGLGNTAHVYDDFAPKLTSLGHVYGITRRGYGASSQPESGYDVAQLGRDLLAALKVLDVRSPVLVGHSYAGQELSYLAAEHRELVAGLVYLDAAYRYAFMCPESSKRTFHRCRRHRRRPVCQSRRSCCRKRSAGSPEDRPARARRS